MSRIIGIDLGTTNSCVAVFEDDEVIVLPNSEGSRTTPSVVGFTESGERLVGQQAKRQAVINPQRTVFGAKRMMGAKFKNEHIMTLAETLPYRLVEAVNGDAWVGIGSQNYSPPEIAAMVLQKMKSTAEDYFGEPIEEAVVTVPAYFDDAQRQATKDAGRIAGLNVRRIINEPTAAALAYGVSRKNDSTLVVFDLGGGTFDVSVVKLRQGLFEVVSTSGNNQLGGDDFDRLILKRLLDVFLEETGIDISDDKMALQRLREAAEAAKCELSTISETNINLPFLAVDNSGPRHLSYQLSRSELNELVADLVDRLDKPCIDAVREAGLQMSDIDEVLLVGGMSRMPLVRERVETIFHRKPNKNINPDEAVAMGAAIQSSILEGELREVLLLDVTPMDLGIKVQGNKMSTVIAKNTTLPTENKKIFTTTEDNQQVVSITVLQGSSRQANENRTLGTFNLGDIAPKPAGMARIEVTFDIDTDGIVHVSARDVETGASHRITITDHGGLSEEEVRRASERANLHQLAGAGS